MEKPDRAFWADILTAIRGVGIPFLLFLFTILGIKRIELWPGLFLLGWITDSFDGTLARSAERETFIRDREIYFDFSMVLSEAITFQLLFPLPSYLSWIIPSWIGFCAISISFRLIPRYKFTSFIWASEVTGAPLLTLGITIYSLFHGNLLITSVMAAYLLGILTTTIPVGLKARERASRNISPFKKDALTIIKDIWKLIRCLNPKAASS